AGDARAGLRLSRGDAGDFSGRWHDPRAGHSGRGAEAPPEGAHTSVSRSPQGIQSVKGNFMTTEQSSAQAYKSDERNDRVLVYVNGRFFSRDEAVVSVFDSGFALGDGVWEGLRLVKGRLISLDAHMDRLFEGARSIDLDIGLDRAGVIKAVQDTLDKNGMT